MKKFTLLLLLFSTSFLGNLEAKLTAFLSFGTFNNPEGTPYLETYLKVKGNTCKPAIISGDKHQSKIELLWLFKQGEKIVHYEKYNLLSPEFSLKDSLVPDFTNQQRISLDAGIYAIELHIKDANSEEPELKIEQTLDLNFKKDTISISDIDFLESMKPTTTENIFSKNGFDLIPNPDNFYPSEIKKLSFYFEVYNTLPNNTDPVLIRYYLSNANNNQLMEDLVLSKKYDAKKVSTVLAEIPIENLPSGNYNFNVEVISKYNKLLAFRKAFIQRSNTIRKPILSTEFEAMDVTNTFISKFNNPDTLAYFIDVLYPISSSNEVNIEENQIQLKDVNSMKKFIYSFWAKRNPADPQLSFTNYMLEVDKANNSFAALNKRGFETDRGRVFLQYGPPSSMTEVKDDPEAYPYEIWHYLKLNNQSNKKFVFYCPELITQNYKLLHSDATGELYNSRWDLDLHARGQQYGPDMDIEKSSDIYGSKSKENFANPK
jgi:GWxTD domain-containing protein